MVSALDDQRAKAEADVAGIAESIRLGLNAAHVDTGDVERADILQALEDLPRCQHLEAIPVQPSLVLLTAEPVAQCTDCFEDAGRQRELRCPQCRAEALEPLMPAALALGHWLAVWLLCRGCVQASAIR